MHAGGAGVESGKALARQLMQRGVAPEEMRLDPSLRESTFNPWWGHYILVYSRTLYTIVSSFQESTLPHQDI